MLLLCRLPGRLPLSHSPRRELTPGSDRCTLLSPREQREGAPRTDARGSALLLLLLPLRSRVRMRSQKRLLR